MSNFVIDITTLTVKRGRTIKPIMPGKDGVFKNVPAFVLGKGSRSTDYDLDYFVQSINRENSVFKLRIEEGNCEGEYGHPFLSGKDVESDIKRLFYIERTRLSHVIHGVHTRAIDGGNFIGEIDIKPTGPMGQHLKESLMDNTINTSFSMRTFCYPPVKQSNGRYLKKIKEFITIDAEGTPGWEEASKRFSSQTFSMDNQTSLESIGVYSMPCSEFNIINVIKQHKEIGKESHNNQLWDLLKADAITIDNTEYVIDVSNRTMMDKNGTSKNIFHSFFRK